MEVLLQGGTNTYGTQGHGPRTQFCGKRQLRSHKSRSQSVEENKADNNRVRGNDSSGDDGDLQRQRASSLTATAVRLKSGNDVLLSTGAHVHCAKNRINIHEMEAYSADSLHSLEFTVLTDLLRKNTIQKILLIFSASARRSCSTGFSRIAQKTGGDLVCLFRFTSALTSFFAAFPIDCLRNMVCPEGRASHAARAPETAAKNEALSKKCVSLSGEKFK